MRAGYVPLSQVPPMADGLAETSSVSGFEQKDDLIEQTSDDNDRHETSHTTTSSSLKTMGPFFIRDLSYTPEEERRIVRIIDTRLFRELFPEFVLLFLVHT